MLWQISTISKHSTLSENPSVKGQRVHLVHAGYTTILPAFVIALAADEPNANLWINEEVHLSVAMDTRGQGRAGAKPDRDTVAEALQFTLNIGANGKAQQPEGRELQLHDSRLKACSRRNKGTDMGKGNRKWPTVTLTL